METVNHCTPRTRDLCPGTDRYVFAEHVIDGEIPARGHRLDYRSLLVLRGAVELRHAQGCRRYGVGQGWHAPPGAAYQIASIGVGPAVVIEAGSVRGQTAWADPGQAASFAYLALSQYTVSKPWGYEVLYTSNLTNPGYALKRITMTAGHQFSLQSHRFKAETSYVIEGEATVLSGLTAPDDITAVVDATQLAVKECRPGTSWTTPPGELHRVIAGSDCTAIEVSTPELDDVIRWQDDAGRDHGRIAAEHCGSGSRT
jgi:quercetin dioxygenase-like cupin family protein